MNMIEAVKSVLSQYVGFRGRARRSEFWYWYLATLIASFIIAILEMLMGLGSDGSGPLSSILTLALFLPTLSVAFRRLHDTGRSGWWIGGFYIAIFAGVAVFLSLAFSVGVDGSDGATAGTWPVRNSFCYRDCRLCDRYACLFLSGFSTRTQ